jgi:hypothetical protein
LTVREDLSYGLSIAGGAVIGAFSWFLNSPLLGVVTGVLLGTGLALLTQSRTQKRAWKRELGLKNIDTIYGPLYREITANLAKGAPTANTSFQQLSTEEWQRIRADYLYHFVPDQLKSLLERHYVLVEKYNSLLGRVTTQVSVTILEKASLFYNRKLQIIQYAVRAASGGTLPLGIDSAVLFAEHPKERLRGMYQDILSPSPEFLVILNHSSPTGDIVKSLDTAADLKKFDEFFGAVCKTVKELDVVVEIRRTLGEINFGGQEVQARTLGQIRDPWSM